MPKTKTFDVHFDDDHHSSSKGFRESFDFCLNYVRQRNGTNDSYFGDYKGGVVSIVNNDTGRICHTEKIK